MQVTYKSTAGKFRKELIKPLLKIYHNYYLQVIISGEITLTGAMRRK